MKKLIFLFLFCLFPIIAFCKSTEWIETQSIIVPDGTPLHYYYTEKGNIKYVISIKDIEVSVSKANAEKYLNGLCKLEIVKWYNKNTGKYKYTTRQYKPSNDVDLQTLFNFNT